MDEENLKDLDENDILDLTKVVSTHSETAFKILFPEEEKTETVLEAGKVLEETAGESKLSDSEIGTAINPMCHSEEQLSRCSREGVPTSKCVDTCCLDSCKAYAGMIASCVSRCVKKSSKRESPERESSNKPPQGADDTTKTADMTDEAAAFEESEQQHISEGGTKCCCTEEGGFIRAMHVKIMGVPGGSDVALAVGASSTHYGTADDASCPIIGDAQFVHSEGRNGERPCACTTNWGAWKAPAKCRTWWTNDEHKALPSHSPGNMGEPEKCLQCIGQCQRAVTPQTLIDHECEA